ncbi:DUF6887 family protein [Merismopedia glauca]|uniref:non-specific serine/threonine protein kinase n=1 Tax=Merismopedia glauca CCAP 1448/3 TaxID=1296344 RepID=A0A2T1BZM1_9CYAN|nr:protein kinase [Merismopedia glauca]PSB01323.1 serine/threonine protein kinase [Merismopedia glauca CCAP 1448/3]
MSLCINPNCAKPSNHDNQLYCQVCGSELLLEGLYRVQRELGGGGFGKVYELSQGNTLKILKILTLSQPIALKLFQQEAEVLGKLNHPGIPKVEPDGYFIYFPKDSKEPLHCLVMEKIEGENLETYLKKKQQPIKQKLALKWLIEIAEILDKVHQEGFLHRDIKPANIMLRPNGQLVLIDFGTVKQITATVMASQAKKQGTGVYTPGYAPPEQEKGFTVLKSDFYALGRTFVHLLTNKHPLAFYNPNTDELDWRGAVPNLSPLLADLLDELMQRLAKDRPKDTGEILQRLGEIEQQLYPPPPIKIQPSPPPQQKLSHSSKPPQPSRKSPSRRILGEIRDFFAGKCLFFWIVSIILSTLYKYNKEAFSRFLRNTPSKETPVPIFQYSPHSPGLLNDGGLLMKPHYRNMTRKELKEHLLAHRNDEEAWSVFFENLSELDSSMGYSADLSDKEMERVFREKLDRKA